MKAATFGGRRAGRWRGRGGPGEVSPASGHSGSPPSHLLWPQTARQFSFHQSIYDHIVSIYAGYARECGVKGERGVKRGRRGVEVPPLDVAQRVRIRDCLCVLLTAKQSWESSSEHEQRFVVSSLDFRPPSSLPLTTTIFPPPPPPATTTRPSSLSNPSIEMARTKVFYIPYY